jgi:hypothetical protein
VTYPISPALQRVKTILFAPFDLRKWFIIGFCAWLSSCGESGGGGGGGGGGGNSGGPPMSREAISRGLQTAWQYVLDNLAWIIPVVILVILLGIAVWLVSVWLNSRGKFMLLHCVALNRGEIAVPWDTYAPHAHSLFVFQALLGAVAFLIVGPILLACGGVLLAALATEGPLTGPLVLLAVGVLATLCVAMVFTIIRKFLVDFVVPIMYLRTPRVWDAWGEFWALAWHNRGRFVLYLLFSVVIALILGTLVMVLVIATCCTAGCLMAIPYIGAVLLLPIYVFKRSYSLYYIEQYGSDYSIIEPGATPPPAPDGLQTAAP